MLPNVPLTRASPGPITALAPPHLTLGSTPLLPWAADTLDAVGAGACLKSLAINGTDSVYAVGEGGVVLKGVYGAAAANGAPTALRTVLNAGFPSYYYGVGVLGASVVVTGFVDGGGGSRGIARTSADGGASWPANATAVLSPTVWAGGPVLAAGHRRLIVPSATDTAVFVADGSSAAQLTWRTVQAGEGWHAGPFVARGASVTIAGVELCRSADAGGSFKCGPSADAVFDGGVASTADGATWLTGGGAIAPVLGGWAHRSRDGGASWSANRTLAAPWPIRTVAFACADSVALAAGGDFSSGVGGIYASADGGATWVLEVDTGLEMAACATGPGLVTCVGSAKGKQSLSITARCP